ncbi:hypothetical protein, partial [Escherichia coli]|uniref:hypothetical protein n=1 Tax=Escherichia coli TaxID=562 RepID=UPI001AEC04B7
MDTKFANELRSMSNLEVSFLSVQNGQVGDLFTTQPYEYQASIIDSLRDVQLNPEAQFSVFYGQRVLSQVLSLANTGDGDQVRVLLQSPLDHALESFAPLDRQFLGIALAVLLVSLAAALLMA